MSNRIFDSSFLTERAQNRAYSRNLYQNNMNGTRIINNPQNANSNASKYNIYTSGAQTEYYRSPAGGCDIVSVGGIVNISPYIPVPPTVPSIPTITSIAPGDTQLIVNFIANSDGGSPIIDYEYTIDNGISWISAGSNLSPIFVIGLTNKTTYQVQIRAVNSVGPSLASNSLQGTPDVFPFAPVITNGTSGDTQVFIAFTSSNDSIYPITNYKYSLDGGLTFIPFSPATLTSPLTITGLTNGMTYNIQIKAVNLVGDSIASNSIILSSVVGGASTIDGNGLLFYLDGANGAPASTSWLDSSGKLNNCSFSITPPVWSNNNSGYYNFNISGGISNQYGALPNNFNYSFSSGLTILAFVNFTDMSGNRFWERILDFGNGAASKNIILARSSNTTNLIFEVFNGPIGNPATLSATLSNGITKGAWNFYAVRLNGSNCLIRNSTSYIDTYPSVLPQDETRNSNFIGRSNFGGDSLFQGQMGIVSMFNTALTGAQIDDFYNVYRNRYGLPAISPPTP
jgi:hypothetical protein